MVAHGAALPRGTRWLDGKRYGKCQWRGAAGGSLCRVCNGLSAESAIYGETLLPGCFGRLDLAGLEPFLEQAGLPGADYHCRHCCVDTFADCVGCMRLAMLSWSEFSHLPRETGIHGRDRASRLWAVARTRGLDGINWFNSQSRVAPTRHWDLEFNSFPNNFTDELDFPALLSTILFVLLTSIFYNNL